MDLKIIPLSYNDYDNILSDWWKDWGWTPPARDFLPQNGEGGLIVWDGDVPVCAGYIYITNSKVSWIDWIISDKNYRNKNKRQKAIELLLETLMVICNNNDSKYAYALIKNKNLIKTYEKLGFTKADNYTQEMIKIFN